MTFWEKVSSSSTENRDVSPPRGLICPVVTPIQVDGTLDKISLGRLLSHVRRHADAILLSDLRWGEGLDFPPSLRLELMDAGFRWAGGRLPVLVCITAKTMDETAALLSEAQRLVDRIGYDGAVFWVDYPLVYHSNRDLPAAVGRMGSGSRFPLLLANDPARVRSVKGSTRRGNIRTAVLKSIARTASVRGMIFTGSFRRSIHYQEAVRRRTDFFFYDGDEAVFLRSPGTGGVVAGGSNLLPELWHDVARSSLNRYDTERQFRAHQAGIWQSGMELEKLYRLTRQCPADRMKRILARVGLIGSDRTVIAAPAPPPSWHEDLTQFLEHHDLL
jgi:dihydrodipicolinate synthase/N-acetylneuraminate lyase